MCIACMAVYIQEVQEKELLLSKLGVERKYD